MTFFFDDEPRQRRRGARVGWTLLLVAILGTTALAWMPSPYVIQQPGSTFDTLGSVTIDDHEVELIEIPGQEVYPTDGSLRLLTVGVVGSRRTPVPWLDIVQAWFDPSKAVIPLDVAYPMGQTVEQSNEENELLMNESQQAAAAAALVELGHDIPTVLTVRSVIPDSPADGIVREGDQVLTANGVELMDAATLQAQVAEAGSGEQLELTLLRDGGQLDVTLTPAEGFAPHPIIGVSVETSYDFPFEVNIELEDVGGPSAGMMFALGIVDKLTPGAMTGGEEIAGTGTLTASGQVGAIGGIRQKLYGAVNAGSSWFLAPAQNCDEVVGHIPDGLSVFSVATLEDALTAVEAIGNGDTAGLPTCTSAGGSA
ncbi:MAG TPA: S16 family serine protease [Homoserinimonas sp.]|nr:S16 family serine protease [Homoserinimonas sp.]